MFIYLFKFNLYKAIIYYNVNLLLISAVRDEIQSQHRASGHCRRSGGCRTLSVVQAAVRGGARTAAAQDRAEGDKGLSKEIRRDQGENWH